MTLADLQCLSFACPGCVAKDRPSYSILSMNNHIYDYHCDSCMADEVALGPAVPIGVVHYSAGSRMAC